MRSCDLALSIFVVAIAGAAVSVACTDLKVAPSTQEGAPDGGAAPSDVDAGASTPAVEAGAPRPGGEDAGPPPRDFACAEDAWSRTTKSRPECAPRQVFVVDPDMAIDNRGISIARTPAGRIGIVYNAELDGMHGEMRLAHFFASSPSFDAVVAKRTAGPIDHQGFVTRIAASAPDTLQVLSHDVIDESMSGDVVLVKLVAGATPFTTPELVASGVPGGVGRVTELALALAPDETTYAAVRIGTGETDAGKRLAKLAARKKVPGSTFTPLPDVADGLSVDDVPGTGATALRVDATGQLHLLYQFCDGPEQSRPIYHSLDGTGWSFTKTVDNSRADGMAGFSPRLAVVGSRKYAAYFYRKALQTPPATAELRLARWERGDDKPTVEVLEQSLPSRDLHHARYRAAMAVDKFGLIHLATILPSTVTESDGALEYWRQTRREDGTINWLHDIVDPDVLSEASDAEVDLVVDDAARPHIAYVSGKDLKIRYATRFDR